MFGRTERVHFVLTAIHHVVERLLRSRARASVHGRLRDYRRRIFCLVHAHLIDVREVRLVDTT